MDEKKRKCLKCKKETKQFHARYPISDPYRPENHVPVGFMGLCKECTEHWTFNASGDLIRRK